MPKFSTNFKSDVVDFDAGTTVEADSIEEFKQAITDFVQSGVLDYITRAALVAREKGHAAKRGGVQVAPPVAGTQTLEQAVQNVQQAFPQAQEIQEQAPPFVPQQVAPAPPVPQPSLPEGVYFQEGGPDGDLKLFLPYFRTVNMKELNAALKNAGARAVPDGKKPDGTTAWADYKRVPRHKQDEVTRVITSYVPG